MKINKIKITLWGLCMIIIPAAAYAELDQSDFDLETLEEQDKKSIILPRGDKKALQEEEGEDGAEDAVFLKLHGDMSMRPSIDLHGDESAPAPENDVKATVKLKADLPEILKDKNVKVNVDIGLTTKEVKLREVAVTLGSWTVGYTDTLFAYKEANIALPITVDASVLQIKCAHTFDCFQFGYSLERPIELKVGHFDKNQSQQDEMQENAGEKKEEEPKVNRLDDPKKKPAFKMKNNLPALGVNIALVKDCFSIDLSGLGRLTDYTHSSNPKNKKLDTSLTGSWGAHLGVQYKIVPKKFTITGQGVYVAGLGDYLSGLAAIQKDEEREEMCACYYLDKDKKESLKTMGAWGIGGTLEYTAIPKWTVAVAGCYLSMREKEDKPGSAFRDQWKLIVPKLTYKFNKHWEMSAGYSMVKERKIDESKNKSMKHTLAGNIKFIF